jgi:hypothetical protein
VADPESFEGFGGYGAIRRRGAAERSDERAAARQRQQRHGGDETAGTMEWYRAAPRDTLTCLVSPHDLP